MVISKKVLQTLLGSTIWIILSAGLCWPQTPKLNPGTDSAPIPIVMFDFVWSSVNPGHYAIAVDSTGTAAYRSDETGQDSQTPGVPYILKFQVSEPTRSRIFELANEVNHFRGNFDYTKGRIAQTGTKTLTYMEGHLPNDFEHAVKGHENSTSYNWSENPAIQELTKIFQNMSSTFEIGRKLEFEKRFDKLGIDAELRNLESMQKEDGVQQLHVIVPVLKNIINDASLMHIARERARKIIERAQQPKEQEAGITVK